MFKIVICFLSLFAVPLAQSQTCTLGTNTDVLIENDFSSAPFRDTTIGVTDLGANLGDTLPCPTQAMAPGGGNVPFASIFGTGTVEADEVQAFTFTNSLDPNDTQSIAVFFGATGADFVAFNTANPGPFSVLGAASGPPPSGPGGGATPPSVSPTPSRSLSVVGSPQQFANQPVSVIDAIFPASERRSTVEQLTRNPEELSEFVSILQREARDLLPKSKDRSTVAPLSERKVSDFIKAVQSQNEAALPPIYSLLSSSDAPSGDGASSPPRRSLGSGPAPVYNFPTNDELFENLFSTDPDEPLEPVAGPQDPEIWAPFAPTPEPIVSIPGGFDGPQPAAGSRDAFRKKIELMKKANNWSDENLLPLRQEIELFELDETDPLSVKLYNELIDAYNALVLLWMDMGDIISSLGGSLSELSQLETSSGDFGEGGATYTIGEFEQEGTPPETESEELDNDFDQPWYLPYNSVVTDSGWKDYDNPLGDYRKNRSERGSALFGGGAKQAWDNLQKVHSLVARDRNALEALKQDNDELLNEIADEAKSFAKDQAWDLLGGFSGINSKLQDKVKDLPKDSAARKKIEAFYQKHGDKVEDFASDLDQADEAFGNFETAQGFLEDYNNILAEVGNTLAEGLPPGMEQGAKLAIATAQQAENIAGYVYQGTNISEFEAQLDRNLGWLNDQHMAVNGTVNEATQFARGVTENLSQMSSSQISDAYNSLKDFEGVGGRNRSPIIQQSLDAMQSYLTGSKFTSGFAGNLSQIPMP
ncbi:MAG: hypothetical protein AAF555_06670 [Verrucomicrobiota bacterium]